MGVVVASNSATSVAANTKSADQVSGRYQFVGGGVMKLYAKASATGQNITLTVGGVDLVADQVIPYTGTAGTLSQKDNIMVEQVVSGGKVELFFRNTTGGAITTDSLVTWDPMPGR